MEEKEIDLRDYIKLIFRNKWLIFGVFLLGIIIAGTLTFYFTSSKVKNYEGKIWLEIGAAEKNILIESPEQLIEKIQEGIYGEYSYKMTILNPIKTNLVQIKIEATEPEKIQNALEKISALILINHHEKIQVDKERLENEINRLRTEIDLLKQEKENLEIKMGKSVSQLDLFFLKDILMAKERQIESLYSNIVSLNNSLGYIQPTQIISSPSISEKPITQKPLLNIIIGGLSGLFLGIFFAFLKEWWKAPISF